MKTELPQYKDHTGPRRTGHTTRLIDKYIQDLFTGEEVYIRDHYVPSIDRNQRASVMDRLAKYVTDRVLQRLSIEHRITTSSDPIYVYINKRDYTLQLKIRDDKTIKEKE